VALQTVVLKQIFLRIQETGIPFSKTQIIGIRCGHPLTKFLELTSRDMLIQNREVTNITRATDITRATTMIKKERPSGNVRGESQLLTRPSEFCLVL
jgi:hypothetical protein